MSSKENVSVLKNILIEAVNSPFYTRQEAYRHISYMVEGWNPDAIRKYIAKDKELSGLLNNAVRNNRPIVSGSATEPELTYDSNKPLSLEEAIKIFKIDTAIWMVDRYVVNRWDVGNGLSNYQIKIWLKRIPSIKDLPVTAPKSRMVVNQRVISPKENKLAMIISDAQIGFLKLGTGELLPFHDDKALSAAWGLAKRSQPDTIVLLGDMLDLPNWSMKYAQSPEMAGTTQPAINKLYDFIVALRDVCPHASIYYIEGNHEVRLQTALQSMLKEAYGLAAANTDVPLVSIENLLNLKDLGVTYISDYPYGTLWLNDNIEVFHGTTANSQSGKTTAAMLVEAQHIQIIGHSHRLEFAMKTLSTRNGLKHSGVYNAGCLCRIDEAVPSARTRKNNWQQGLIMINYTNSEQDINCVPIVDGELYWNGIKIKVK